MRVFVGHDAREQIPFSVLEANLASFGHEVIPIKHRELRDAGKFNREWLIDSDGQYYDRRDLKPFSTEFSHTRFAAIPLAREMGIRDWCMFVDCDFLFLEDPAQMLDYKDEETAISCVQYKWQEPEGKKMDGMLQLLYHRKLWSSMFLFRPDHPAHDWLTFHRVNWATGAEMHAFCWVGDDEISEVPPEWNWIPNFTDPDIKAKAVHWSYGGPWMPGYENVAYAQHWREMYHDTLKGMVDHRVALDPDKAAHGRIT
jgi:hypothetical protein